MIVDTYAHLRIHISVCKCLSVCQHNLRVLQHTKKEIIKRYSKSNYFWTERRSESASERTNKQTLDAFKEIQQNKKLRRWEIVFMNIAPTKCYAHTHTHEAT